MFLVVSTLVITALGLLYLNQLHQQATLRQLENRQSLLAAQTARHIEDIVNGLQEGLNYLAADQTLLRHPDRAEQQLGLMFKSAPTGLLTALYLKDLQGNILAEYPPNRLAQIDFPVHLLASGHASNHAPGLIALADDSVLQLSQPMVHQNQPLAEFAALVSVSHVKKALLDPLEQQCDLCVLIDNSGLFVHHQNPELIGASFNEVISPRRQPQLFQILSAMTRGERGHRACAEPLTPLGLETKTDSKSFWTYLPLQLPGTRWSLALALPQTALESFQGDLSGPFFPLVVGLVLTALLSWSLLRISRHNQHLVRGGEEYRLQTELLRNALEGSESRYRHLLDNAGDAMFFIDPQTGALQEVNRQAEELLGYSAGEIRALSLSVLFPGRERRRYLRLVKKVMSLGYGEESNLLFRCKSGRLFTGAVHARLGRLGEQQVVHGVVRDVTEIKRIEQELRQKNRDLTLVNRIAHRAAASSDLEGTLQTILEEVVTNFNADGGGIYLLRHEGTDLELLVHLGIEEQILEELRHLGPDQGVAGLVATTGRPRSSANLHKDRRLHSKAVRQARWRGFQAVPLVASETTMGVLFVFSRSQHLFSRDEVDLLVAIGRQVGTTVKSADLFDALHWQYRLTEASNRELEFSRQKLRENLVQLEEANRELEKLDLLKSNFLTLASHELRTPLTYVLSGAELLEASLGNRLQNDEQKVLNAVQEGGKRLEAIVNDLLEVARIEAQSTGMSRETVNLPLILEDIEREFQPVLAQRQLSLSATVTAPPAPLELHGDTQHLARSIRRLVENAVKFTPEGGEIEISCSLLEPEQVRLMEPALQPFGPAFFDRFPPRRFIQLSVCDNGIGISPDEQLRIFDKFYEIGNMSNHYTSKTRFGGKGVGLGLALVKGTAEAHGGLVWVESPPAGAGNGSAFHLLLPLSQ